jgi:hypothetical protein
VSRDILAGEAAPKAVARCGSDWAALEMARETREREGQEVAARAQLGNRSDHQARWSGASRTKQKIERFLYQNDVKGQT